MIEENGNTITLELADDFHPVLKVNGFKIFVYFVFCIAASQLFYNVINVISLLFLVISLVLLLYVLLLGSNTDYFLFLFFNCLIRLTIPFSGEREFSLMLPVIFLTAIIYKSFLLSIKIKIKKRYLNKVSISLFFFFLLIIVTFFNKFHFPGGSANSGFLARWELINTIVIFFSILLTYKSEILDILLEKFYKFYLIVLSVSLIIVFLNIKKIPIFNTFSWMLIQENSSSKRMIIVGVAGVMAVICILCFEKFNRKTLLLFLLAILGIIFSGGRSSFLQFFIILFCYWAIKNKILGKAILFSLLPVSLFIVFSLSPLVSYVPTKFQRLFVIFPSEFYSGSLKKELKNSSAASSSNFRYEMWSKAVVEMPDNLLIGKGFGVPKAKYELDKSGMDAFRKISSKTLTEDFMTTGGLHNTYVSIAFIMGIPAFLFFSYGFIKLIIRTYLRSLKLTEKLKRQMTFFTLILIYYFIKSVISDIYFELDFFAFLAIIFKTVYIFNGQKDSLNTEIKIKA